MKYSQAIQFARKLRKNQTPAETFVWEKVRNKRFHGYKFYRQYIIQYEDIPFVQNFFIVDFCCFSSKLIIELDGPIHKFSVTVDQTRDKILNDLGFNVIRFTNEEVLKNWEVVARKILKNLK